jgi:hypothetical protein
MSIYEDVPDRPRLDEAGFDDRLISAARLLKLTGKVALDTVADPGGLTLRCARCGGLVTMLMTATGSSWVVTPQQILQDTLRHLVTAHDQPLSAAAEGHREGQPEGHAGGQPKGHRGGQGGGHREGHREGQGGGRGDG